MRFRPTKLRTRLTLWYMAILATLLILFWGGTCAMLLWRLERHLDRFCIEEIETTEGLLFFANGRLGLRQDYHNHSESKNVIEYFVEVRSPSGEVLFRNERLGDRSLAGAPFTGEGVGGYSPRTYMYP